MTTAEFPQYDASIAAGLAGPADGAGGLATFLGIEHVEVGAGALHARLAVRDDLLTPFRNMHGGVLAALCDHVLGTVLYPVIPRGAWAATTEFKINYLAAVTTGVLDARARIISLTKRTAVVRIDVENEQRLVCAAQGTVLIVTPSGYSRQDTT
jgi:1,4-dihydroxy-2-naphthoyl-CoA hydrolase